MTHDHGPMQGQHHDLAELLEQCLRVPLLAGAADVRVRWIGTRAITRQRSALIGSYADGEVAISRRLDHAWVPAYYVRDVLGHELLHHLDTEWREGEDAHHARFRALEAQLPGHARACAWHARNIGRLLGKVRTDD